MTQDNSKQNLSNGMKSNPVVHFEMPVKDGKRVSDFYGKCFGWKMQQMGAEMGKYILAQTTECDETGRPKKPGTINGGFFKLDEEKTGMHPSVVIAVDNVEESMKKIKDSGGEILGEIMDIPGVGKYVSFRDTEGNRVGMLQPSPQM